MMEETQIVEELTEAEVNFKVEESATQEKKFQLRSFADIKADLAKPVPRSRLKELPKAGAKFLYIPWFYAVKALDKYAPGWSYEIVGTDVISRPEKLEYVMKVRLTIRALEGNFSHDAAGTAMQEWDDSKKKLKPVYGGLAEIAESAALRRAAAKHGLCLDLYIDE
jgi:hypothetical protein